MGLANCRRCKQPYVSHTNLTVCNNCQSREQHLFESYYFRLIRDFESLNLEQTAKNTGLDWERLVEAIHVRLGTSKKFRHLKYWKPGICYVCRNRQSSPDSKEPICLTCLDAFMKSVANDKQPTHEEPSPGPNTLVAAGRLSNIDEARVAIVQAHQQLRRYKSLFGELVPQPSQRIEPYVIPSSDEQMALWEEKTNEVMDLMERPDSTLALSHDEWVQVETELGLQEFMMVSVLKVKGFRR
jgi:hypothetical protein